MDWDAGDDARTPMTPAGHSVFAFDRVATAADATTPIVTADATTPIADRRHPTAFARSPPPSPARPTLGASRSYNPRSFPDSAQPLASPRWTTSPSPSPPPPRHRPRTRRVPSRDHPFGRSPKSPKRRLTCSLCPRRTNPAVFDAPFIGGESVHRRPRRPTRISTKLSTRTFPRPERLRRVRRSRRARWISNVEVFSERV